MSHKPRLPIPILFFLPEETESAVAFGVDFRAGEVEALGYGGFHFCYGALAVEGDVGGYAVTAVHDEGAFIHPCLRALDEVEIVCPSGPGRVDMGCGMEDGFQILPLTCISETETGQCMLAREKRGFTYSKAILPRVRAACTVPTPDYQDHYYGMLYRVANRREESADLASCGYFVRMGSRLRVRSELKSRGKLI
jgi:hypothetical protein